MSSAQVRRSTVAAAVLAAICNVTSMVRAEDESAFVESENRVAETAIAKNPSLAAVVSDLRRAQLLQEAEAHRYPFTLLIDGAAVRSGAPQLGLTGVTFPTSTTYSIGAELRRKLDWGTDLSLRIEGSRQQSTASFFFASMGESPTQTLFELGPGYGASVRLSLTQPLLRGAGRDVVLASLMAARAERNTASFTRNRTVSQLLLDALAAYWELYYASRALDIHRRSLDLARQQRDDTAARVQTGSIAPVELLTFESRIASLQEDIVAAEGEERRRSTALGRLLGDEKLMPRRAADTEPTRRATSASDDLRRRALDSSPEISEQRSALKLAEVQARTAADASRPRLDIAGYVQADGLGNREVSPVVDQLGTLDAVSAQVTLTYEVPLDDTRHRAENDRARLAVTAATQRLHATIQKVLADLDDADQRRVSASRRIELTERTLAVSNDQMGAERARFKTGTGTALQVRAAEDDVRTAELRIVRARVDLTLAELELLHLTGDLVSQFAR